MCSIKGLFPVFSEMDLADFKTLADLCAHLGVPLRDLLIRCLICDKFLDYCDLQNFEAAIFTIVWRGRAAHGICEHCARISAVHENNHYYQGCYSADDFLMEYGESVFCVRVRCLKCLHLLNWEEVDSMVESQQPFHLVRNRLRGLCAGCNEY